MYHADIIHNQQNALQRLWCILFTIFSQILKCTLLGFLYIMDLTNARRMGHIKISIMQHSVDAITLFYTLQFTFGVN
jgi:hypothetical protein